VYGIFQAFFLCFLPVLTLEGPPCSHDLFGQPSSIWITGTLIYGLVVIVVNIKLLFSVHNHTFMSFLVNFLSIASFYVMFYVENTLDFVPQLNHTFFNAMIIPSYYLLICFFILFTMVTEFLMYWTGVWYKQRKEVKKKIEEKKKMLKKRQIQPVVVIRPTIKHMGFAFDSESGNVP